MIVVRLYGQFHLSCMVCYHPAAVIPADFIDGFAEGVEGKHRKGGEHRQHDAPSPAQERGIEFAFSFGVFPFLNLYLSESPFG